MAGVLACGCRLMMMRQRRARSGPDSHTAPRRWDGRCASPLSGAAGRQTASTRHGGGCLRGALRQGGAPTDAECCEMAQKLFMARKTAFNTSCVCQSVYQKMGAGSHFGRVDEFIREVV